MLLSMASTLVLVMVCVGFDRLLPAFFFVFTIFFFVSVTAVLSLADLAADFFWRFGGGDLISATLSLHEVAAP